MEQINEAERPANDILTSEPAAVRKPKFDRSIVEGPLSRAVWKIAWPTMLTNGIAGMQGMVDHVLVGNLVGFRGNAAMGVSFQIFLVVIVFMSSLFTGMSVLVARFAGAHDEDKVNATVYQGFITAVTIALVIMAPIGYFSAPYLLDFVSQDAGVKAEALPFLRIMCVFSIGLMLYFMTSGALRHPPAPFRRPLRHRAPDSDVGSGAQATVCDAAATLWRGPQRPPRGSVAGQR